MELTPHIHTIANGTHVLLLDFTDCHATTSTYTRYPEGNFFSVSVFDVTKQHLLELIRQLTEAASAIKEE